MKAVRARNFPQPPYVLPLIRAVITNGGSGAERTAAFFAGVFFAFAGIFRQITVFQYIVNLLYKGGESVFLAHIGAAEDAGVSVFHRTLRENAAYSGTKRNLGDLVEPNGFRQRARRVKNDAAAEKR